jgi:dienelactone hydrolase
MIGDIHHVNTVVIVLHEIYGINKHISGVCEKTSKHGMDSIAPDMLNGRAPFSYDQEMLAYNYFIGSVGFANAFQQVKTVLHTARANYEKVYVLGYSVGATLAWLCSETGLCDLAIGFYGSRIRDYLEIKPTCPVLLFFATEEKALDVDDLIVRLSNFDTIQIAKLDGHHGFADPYSRRHNKKSSMKAYRKIISFIKKDRT